MQLVVYLREQKVSWSKLPSSWPAFCSPTHDCMEYNWGWSGFLGKWSRRQNLFLTAPLHQPKRWLSPLESIFSWVLFLFSSQKLLRKMKSLIKAEIRERQHENREEKSPETSEWGNWGRRGYVFLGSLVEIETLFPRDRYFSTRGKFYFQELFGNVWSKFWLSHLGKGYYWNLVHRSQGCC